VLIFGGNTKPTKGCMIFKKFCHSDGFKMFKWTVELKSRAATVGGYNFAIYTVALTLKVSVSWLTNIFLSVS